MIAGREFARGGKEEMPAFAQYPKWFDGRRSFACDNRFNVI
jgi:hypothetical protein